MDYKIPKMAKEIAIEMQSDIVFYSGEINQDAWLDFQKMISEKRHHPNVILVLITPGGDPHAAYKIARILQTSYESFSVLIPSWCKSAGTLIAIASSKLYISNTGDLGPLDIQIAKRDNIGETSSGLTLEESMESLEQTASSLFISTLNTIIDNTRMPIMLA